MATDTSARHGQIAQDLPPNPLQRMAGALLSRLWYLHAPIQLTITLPPLAAIAALKTAARPSTERLHLRNVFAGGRRYYLQALANGDFMMTTNAKQSWRYAHRTSTVTVMTGTLQQSSDLTQVTLRSRMKLTYLLDVLWLPIFITSLVVLMPWPGVAIIGLMLTLFGLSWFGHRYHAALEAYEMIFFIEKALEDFLPPLAPQIEQTGGHVVYDLQRDFASAWETFYQQVVQPDTEDRGQTPHV